MGFALLMLFLVPQESVSAELDVEQIGTRISGIDSDLKRLREAITGFTKTTNQISVEVGRLELERAILSSEVKRAELQIQLTNREQTRIEQERQTLTEKAASQEQAIGSRLRQLYKRGKLGYAHVFLTQSKLDDLLSAFHYARHMTERDHQAILSYRDTFKQLGLLEVALETTKLVAEEAYNEHSNKRGELDELLNKRNRRLQQLRREQNKKRSLARELELERSELDMMIKRLLSDEPENTEFRVPISKYKGKLDWPAKGAILRHFGVIRDPEFRTERRQKGIDIQAERGSQVTAVYSGRVIYADWFKSYGNLIILDHGDDTTTFYAHNDHINVKKGDFVERNSAIASSGDTGSLEGPFLHFEIRHQGSPENPTRWLRPSQK